MPLRQEPSGHAVTGRVCALPDEGHHSEGVHATTWVWKGIAHNYRVRQRLGWSHLRDLLVQASERAGTRGGRRVMYATGSRGGGGVELRNKASGPDSAVWHAISQCLCVVLQECHPGGKLTAYVLSLGRPLYIQVSSSSLPASALGLCSAPG